MQKRLVVRLFLGLALLISAGCDTTSTQPDITSLQLPSAVDPVNFDATIASPNPLFPLVVGSSSRFVGQTPGGEEVILVEVTNRTKVVQGVTTTVVRDRVWLDGELIEDTDDWFAQDKDGNVWYFGEEAKDYKDGQLIGTAGSWEAGVDGAMAGVVMWAEPKVGSIYYQEFYRGEAEDIGEVLSLNETVEVPYGKLEGCVKTEDTTPLEPDVVEHKYFCPGIGHALTVDITEGGIRFELTEFG